MSDLERPIISLPDVTVDVRDLLSFLRQRSRLNSLLLETLAEKTILHAALAAGLTISTQELQQAVNRFRRQLGLNSVEQTQAWLGRRGLTASDLEQTLERDLLITCFKDHIVRDRVASHFDARRDRYASIRFRQLVVADENLARELHAQLTEEHRDFAELARVHSLDLASARSGGDTGRHLRCQLPAAFADALFHGGEGDIIGPLRGAQGFYLFHIDQIRPAELDEPTTALISRELFDAWLLQKLAGARIDLSCLEASR